MLDPPSRDFLPDTVRVFGPAESASYVEMICRVSPVGPVVGEDGPVPFGTEKREFGFVENPGVTEKDQMVAWLANGSDVFDDPKLFRTSGAALKPGGGNGTWRVFASSDV